MKRELFTGAFAAICLSVAAYGTILFFTTEDAAVNVITAGTIKIDLQEKAIPGDGGDLIDFVDVTSVMPGTEVSKIVQVENAGDEAAFIRVKLDKALDLAEGIDGEVDLNLVMLNVDTENWTIGGGYYYYNKPLKSGETTEPLFTEVGFSKDMGDHYRTARLPLRWTPTLYRQITTETARWKQTAGRQIKEV